MSRREIQKLIDTAPSSWKKMFKRYRLGSRPTVKKLIDTVLEYTPSGELYGEKGRAMFKPPAKVRKEAMDGLILSHDQNYTSDSGIGLVRAMQLVVEPKVSERTIKRMKSYFARSGKDTPKRFMAWLNWGGDSGKKWADSIKTNPKVNIEILEDDGLLQQTYERQSEPRSYEKHVWKLDRKAQVASKRGVSETVYHCGSIQPGQTFTLGFSGRGEGRIGQGSPGAFGVGIYFTNSRRVAQGYCKYSDDPHLVRAKIHGRLKDRDWET